MNPTSPVQTGMAAFAGSQLGPVVVYFAQVVHLPPPNDNVAATIGALMVMITHFAMQRFFSEKPPVTLPETKP